MAWRYPRLSIPPLTYDRSAILVIHLPWRRYLPSVSCELRTDFATLGYSCTNALQMGSILPLMLIGLPRIYGAWQRQETATLSPALLAGHVRET